MKKIMIAVCVCLFLSVMGYARNLSVKENATKEIEKQAVQLQKKTVFSPDYTIGAQLQCIAGRLAKQLNRPVSTREVVGGLYKIHTADFEEMTYTQFKWERSQRWQSLMGQAGHEEELASLQEDIPVDDFRFVQFAGNEKHVIDYAFAKVFSAADREKLYDYGNGPANYDAHAYPPIPDAKKFLEKTELQMQNLINLVDWLSTANNQSFNNFWNFVLE